MIQLENEIKLKGTGIAKLTSKLIIRTEKKAIYLRNDGYYEVFNIPIEKAGEVFGKHYEERERYPGNEEFGNIAWTYKTIKQALIKYQTL